MQFLIVFACALAAVSAGYVAPVAYYPGAQHFPVINHEGVPVDTADVQYAKAAHYSHKFNAYARNGDVAEVAHPVHHHVIPEHAPLHPIHAVHPVHHLPAHHHGEHAYPTTAVAPESVNGVPLETPEVVAAKANHFAAHSEALARTGYPDVVYRHRRGIYAPAAYTAAAYPYAASPYAHTFAHPYGYGHYY